MKIFLNTERALFLETTVPLPRGEKRRAFTQTVTVAEQLLWCSPSNKYILDNPTETVTARASEESHP